MAHFSTEAAKALEYYVYRLIDPRDGQTFYVGKGSGNRVFDHAAQQLEISNDLDIDEDDSSLKLRAIGEIRAAGLEVIHVIHRHGMDEATSYEVEAALIDAYPGLSNIAGGHGNGDFGCAHVKQLEQKYNAKPAPIDQRFIAVNVSRSIEECGGDYYIAARYAWRISEWRRKMGAPVAAYQNGIIRAVFEIQKDGWLPADDPEFKAHRAYGKLTPNRWGFVSYKTSEEARNRYVGKRLPDSKRSYGSPLLFLGPNWELEKSCKL